MDTKYGSKATDGGTMIRIEFEDDYCEDCGCDFKRPRYTSVERCKACEHVYQLRRIADVLEYWVGMQ